MLWRTPALCLACLVLRIAAAAEPAADVDALSPVESAPVVIDGVTLFHVAGSASFPATERARHITTRIIAAARDSRLDVDAVATQPRDGRIDILARGKHLVGVIDADAALEDASLANTALVRTMRIREALTRYRAERTRERLLESSMAAAAALAIATSSVLLIWWVFRRARLALERRYRARIHSLAIQSFEIVRAESIWRALNNALNVLRWLLIVAIVYAAVTFALRQFPWTRSAGERALEIVVTPVVSIATGLLGYLPKLVFLLVLLVLVRYLLKLLRLFFDAIGAGRIPMRSFDAEWAQPTYHIVRILMILLALVIAYPYLPGSGSAAFQGLSIFAGLMLSLGASSAMASLIAGYTVTYRRAFRVGDRITIGDLTGVVSDVRLLVTHLRTAKNEEIVVPNSVVLQSHVVNYSRMARSHGLILHTTVSIGYETPWRQVEAMLKAAAERTQGVLSEPPPFVLEKSLGDFAVTYELNVHVDSAAMIPERYAELHRHVLDVFNEYGVQIMTPAYEGDPPEPKIVPKEKWFVAPASRPAEPRDAAAGAR